MTPDELAAIRERDEANEDVTRRTVMQDRADRRALLAEVDRLRTVERRIWREVRLADGAAGRTLYGLIGADCDVPQTHIYGEETL